MRLLHALLLALACFGVYANGYDHAYNLDSSHVIRDNPAIRELSWRQVGRYFTDPGTSTSLYSNADYRPVLQVVNALNHAWDAAAGEDDEEAAAATGPREPPGYRMPRWHAVQVALHLVCVLALYALARTGMRLAAGGYPPAGESWIAFLAALVFALHPTGSGVVNYLSARSSLLTAAFLLPALVLHLGVPDEGRRGWRGWTAVALFALALFTKVEAVAALAALLLVETWRTARLGSHQRGFLGDLVATPSRRTALLLLPFLVVTAAYGVARSRAMAAFDYAEASAATGVEPHHYLLTQTVAWWHYVEKALAPFGLVADDQTFPIFRTLGAAPVLAAVGGWLLVAALLLAQWRRRPWLLVLAASALALLSPTSSVVPLAEMVNEHRPYLPLALLSLAWLLPLGAALVRGPVYARFRLLGALGLVAVLAGFARATWERNEVFRTPESYWLDVIAKAPSARAYNNYGLRIQRRGDYLGALEYFEKSVELAPFWHVSHVNLAICYENTGDPARAREHYDRAVDYDGFSGTARTWRGEHHLAHGRWAEARDDLEAAATKSLEHFRLTKGLATAYAGLGDAEASFEHTARCLDLDRERTFASIIAMFAPFWQPQNYAAGVEYFRLLGSRLPDTPWVWENLARLAEALGRTEEAAEARERARALGADV